MTVRRNGTLGITSWDGESACTLAGALIPPTTHCIETDVTDVPSRSVRGSSHGYLSLTVTTRSAYRYPIAKLFVAALTDRVSLSEDLRERVHIVLHEAVSNAVMHGNLGTDSSERDTLTGLAALQTILATNLAVESRGRAMIQVEAGWTKTMLHMAVRDSGTGFDYRDLPTSDQRKAAGRVGSGRGLEIIRSLSDRVAFVSQGAGVAMDFRLKPAARSPNRGGP